MSGDEELLRAFFVESEGIIEKLESDIGKLESAPGDVDLINAVFRGLHTIKGNSSFLSLDNVTKISHAAETLLDKARKREILVDGPFLEAVRRVFEDLRSMIVEQQADIDISEPLRVVDAILKGKGHSAPPAQKKAEPVPAPVPAAAKAPAGKVEVGSYVRVDEGKVNRIVSLVGELELLRYALEKFPDRLEPLGREASDIRFDLDLQVSKLSRLTKSLSGIVFGVRLVPVNTVFQRFPRVVRDLAAKLGKEIRLEIINGSAEMDKSIVEAIADPMTHLIRNSADHGIETMEERASKGKPRLGTIKLNSYVRGNYVFIEIADDGRGIDGDKILAKAISKGLVPAEKSREFTDSKKMGLIFLPGFSTAEAVTDISGRGVGMDVVKSNINRLKGTVIINSKVGKGTVIQLRFPMSVVVLFSLFVEVNGTPCALPVTQVNESIDYFPRELLASVPKDARPGEYLAVFSLKSLLWGEPEIPGDRSVYHVLRFKESRGRNLAFIVDDYTSIEEAVVQSVDSYIAAMPGIQGATVRKDGTVGIVLNTESIVELALKSRPLAFVKVREKVEVDTSNLSEFLELAKSG
jgi:two-component system, chemotaxis family, sensor kinase CheA